LTNFEIEGILPGQDNILPAPASTAHSTPARFDIFELDQEQPSQQLLDFLILPSLVNLSYDSHYNPSGNVSAFLQRSGCSVTELRIMDHDHDHFSEMAPVSGLQALESLEYHGYLDGCLRCLNRPTNKESGSIFLPNLHRLAVWDVPKIWSGLADLFLSRPLKTLTIHPLLNIDPMDETSWVDKETVLRFQDLVEKGYDITIMGRLLLVGDNGEIRDLLPWFIEARTSEARMDD